MTFPFLVIAHIMVSTTARGGDRRCDRLLTDDVAEPPIARARDPLSHTTIHRVPCAVEHRRVGSVDGGTVLEWMHRAAHATAARWGGHAALRRPLANFHLDRPIRVGESGRSARLPYLYPAQQHAHPRHGPTGRPCRRQSGPNCPVPNRFRRCRRDRGSDCGAAVDDRSPCSNFSENIRRGCGYGREGRSRTPSQRADTTAGIPTAPRTTRHILVSRTDVPQRRRRPRRSGHAVDRRSGECLCGHSGPRSGLTSYVAAIRFCGPRRRRPDGRVGTNHSHRTAQRPRRCPRRHNATWSPVMARVAAEGLLVVASLDEQGRARRVRSGRPRH